MKDSKMLTEKSIYQIKDKDKPTFKEEGYFPSLVIEKNFMVWKSKIFYIFTKQMQAGILDREELEEL